MAFNYAKLRAQLIEEEALRLKPYDDKTGKDIVLPSGGNVTIGIGRNLTGCGISAGEAESLFQNDVSRVVLALDHDFPWAITLADARHRALISMCFNMGIEGLHGFTKFLAALKAGDFATAAAEMRDSDWYGEVGRRGPKLVNFVLTGTSPENV